jgi:hypothetical protein
MLKSSTKLQIRAEQSLHGSNGAGGERVGVGGLEEEITQEMYAHVNK